MKLRRESQWMNLDWGGYCLSVSLVDYVFDRTASILLAMSGVRA